MKFELIEQAKIEAYRFIAKANNAEKRVRADKTVLIGKCKEIATLKRASMDLSRILTELRKPAFTRKVNHAKSTRNS